LIKEYEDEIISYKTFGGVEALVTKKQIWIGKVPYKNNKLDIDIIFSPKYLTPVSVGIDRKEFVHLWNIKRDEEIPTNIAAENFMTYENTIYIKNGGQLTELRIDDVGDRIIPSVKQVWQIMPHASQLFDGVLYQNVLGKGFLVIPRPTQSLSKLSSCSIVEIPELKGYRIIDAKRDGHVVMISGHNGSEYSKFVLRFDQEFKTYDCRRMDDVDPPLINFVTLENGVVISINGDDSLEIFSQNPKHPKMKVVKDPQIDSSMTLSKDGIRVLFQKDKRIFSLKMKG